MIRATAMLLAALALAGCGASTPIPDFRYYRMPEAAVSPRAAPAVAQPIVVDSLLADGEHGEQSVLYALKEGGAVKSYHYQLWSDPPGRMLQRRLIRLLRESRFSSGLVADRLPSQVEAIRITGQIERFERLQVSEGQWVAAVRLELRAERGTQELPLVLATYESKQPADTDTMQGTTRAFAAAIDDIYARFLAELEAAAR